MTASALTTKTLTPNVTGLIDIILEENPMHKSFMVGALEHVTAEELDTLDKYLEFCQSKDLDLAYMANSYLTIVGCLLYTSPSPRD